MGDFLQLSTSLLAQEETHVAAAETYSPKGDTISYWIYLGLVLLILLGIIASARGGLNERVFKKRTTSYAEQLFLFIENMCVGTIGPHGRKYIPMIITFWLVIFFGNVFALFFGTSPTASLSFNLGMALISIGYVQWEGIKANGVFGHFSHFAGPKLGLAMIPITGMIFVIEIISEVMKNVSLSLRLYGNIHGGHQAVEAMNHLGMGIFVPFGEFLLPIKILTCVVQAMIFTLLTCVYLSLVTHHEEGGHGDPGEGGHGTGMPAAAH
jgi:F-type H+-transporting ATPase subunit a